MMASDQGNDLDRMWGLAPGAEPEAQNSRVQAPKPALSAVPQAEGAAAHNPLDELEAVLGTAEAQPTRTVEPKVAVVKPVPVVDRTTERTEPTERQAPVDDLLWAAKEKALRENFGRPGPSELSPVPAAPQPARAAPPAQVAAASTAVPAAYREPALEPVVARVIAPTATPAVDVVRDIVPDNSAVQEEDWSRPVALSALAHSTPSRASDADVPRRARARDEGSDPHDDDEFTALQPPKPARPFIRRSVIITLALLALGGVAVLLLLKPIGQFLDREAPVAVGRNAAPVIPPGAYQAGTGAPAGAPSENAPYANIQRVERSSTDPVPAPVAPPPAPVASPPSGNPFQPQSVAPRSVPPSLPNQASSSAAPGAAGGWTANPAEPPAPAPSAQLRLSAGEPDLSKEKFAEIFGAQEAFRKDIGGINKQLASMKLSHDGMARRVESFDAQLNEIRRALAELRRAPVAAIRPVASASPPAPVVHAPPVLAKAVKLQAIVPDFAVIGIDNEARTVKVGDEVAGLGRVVRIDVPRTRVTFESGYELGIQ